MVKVCGAELPLPTETVPKFKTAGLGVEIEGAVPPVLTTPLNGIVFEVAPPPETVTVPVCVPLAGPVYKTYMAAPLTTPDVAVSGMEVSHGPEEDVAI